MKHAPIRRNNYLQPLSREHHQGLLLCWKIRTGFRKTIDPLRIKAYTNWFYEKNLAKHFEIEEDFIFPLLGADHPLVKKAIAEHRRLSRLFSEKNNIIKALSFIEEDLEKHIRFEERILFHEVEQVASQKELSLILEIHQEMVTVEDWGDEFWI
ncbi:MAG: hemerythrin domain-containing protein [Bacteroidetes bacterium]|nr:hemerythrin domain-containing protein [Bacteroidota bacterium]